MTAVTLGEPLGRIPALAGPRTVTELPGGLTNRNYKVTTPGGCTIAGLLTMEDGRIRSTLARTIEEAARVAGGLGKPGSG